MAYTNAIFYMDYELGSDATRTTLTNVVFSNPSSTTVLGTKTAHGLVTGAVITVSGCTQAYANTTWKITKVDDDTFTVDTALWASWNGADVTGDVVPFGGQSWADAWKTITSGATAARIAPGDIVRVARSPAPTSLCNATWNGSAAIPTAITATGTANNGSGLIRVTTATNTLATNDIVQIIGINGTVEANGDWVITVINATTFDLVGSTYVNAWATSSGNTIQKINAKTVYLDTAQNTTIDNCETAWNAVTGIITVLNSTPTNGGTGYAVNDTFNITTGGTGATGIVTSVSGGVVTGVSLQNGGNGGYTTGTGKATTKIIGSGDNALTVNITTVGVSVITRTAVATDAKQGSYSMKLEVPTSCSYGTKIGYLAISPGTLASYQKISFWIKNSAAITAGQWKVCLCSDSSGDTIVDSFLITAIPSTTQWLPLTLTKSGGGNLGASTASIAIYTDTVAPTSASNIFIDNIIACTTSGLNLQSLISKNSLEQGGSEGWYGIQSINNRIVLLDTNTNCKGNSGRGYSGTNENVPTYIRETIKTSMVSSSTTVVQDIKDSGTVGNNIQFQGGYNTSTNEQTGDTFFDGLNGYGYGLQLNTKTYCTINYLGFFRYYYGVYFTNSSSNNTITTITNVNNNGYYGVSFSGSSNNTITTITNANNNGNAGVYFSSCNNNTITTITNANNNITYGVYYVSINNNTITTITNVNNNGSYGTYFSTISNNNIITTITNINNNGSYGVYFTTSNNNIITTITNINNNGSYGVYFSGSSNNTITTITNVNNNGYYGVSFSGSSYNIIKSLYTSANSTSGVFCDSGKNYLYNATLTESTEFGGTSFSQGKIYSQNHDNTANNHWIFAYGGTINSLATTRSGGSGIMWKMAITSTTRLANYPLRFEVAKVAVIANKLVTVKAWMKKDHTTNVKGYLTCRVGQIAWSDGANDVTTECSSADTDWHEVTITFTPTEAGVVEIEADAIYVEGNSNVYVEDMTISQTD